MYKKRYIKQKIRGFTLVELVVVMGIVVVISTITLTSYSKFGGRILLRNLAYDIGLTIRQAQVHGISAQQFNGSGFSSGNGIFIDLNTSNTQFILYTDSKNGDGFYTVGQNELMDTYTLGRGYTIQKICVTSSGTEYCDATKTDILFKRPEPDAIIRAYRGNRWSVYDSVRMHLVAPQGYAINVLVEASGQISIQN